MIYLPVFVQLFEFLKNYWFWVKDLKEPVVFMKEPVKNWWVLELVI
jgi:hypothetical protein